ncbi:N-methylhydantoinase A [Tistlia consotensis]|uniref:N-methylhydantoinase A n=1 Tax=Tistlia consotensis USBA 355 TaxID=560819 RepID=A0A1Y6C1V6_9PROT|nr:hydantoinase/oxoprolinase family protein [Tistlia consotensis]SMF31079.1 N-methylhydantoinase A [Tistlia consotensis USBA 355]SNS19270.1 N-methylhydantoinase A [Tistlia consotensis]
MAYRVGVDIGGSFTDFAFLDEETGELKSLKVFSRPDEPGAEVTRGVARAAELYGITPQEIGYFTHGTTVGINTVITRKGLRLALMTTEGFRDVLELERLKIPDMYNLLSRRPEPLITRDMVWGVPGRLNARGEEVSAVDVEAVRAAARAAWTAGAEGIVVALLHSYRNPAHEELVGRIATEETGLPIFLSSATRPIIREYERTITAVIGAYVQPRVANYLTQLQVALKRAGVAPEPRLTKSNGGLMTAEEGKSRCVDMILSGTASGVIGAAFVAGMTGLDNCLSLDIGGTSADVAVIASGKPAFGTGEQIGDFRIYIPSVSVSSIGEGGGSIAWVDRQNALRVGPESAGSIPGPACYGKGGDRPTITDAFVTLGLVGHAGLGYDTVSVDAGRARAAIVPLAEQTGQSVEEVAESIIEIAVSGMFAGVSGLISRFGVDPREFSLLAFGGAGPMLACFLARELHMREVVVPTTPGVLSALGGLIADMKNDFVQTIYADLSAELLPDLAARYAEMRQDAIRWLQVDQGHRGDHVLAFSAEMRYRGQSFEIDTPVDLAMLEGDGSALAAAFHAEHERLYGHCDPGAAIQVITLRLVIAGSTGKPKVRVEEEVPARAEPHRTAAIRIDGQTREVGLHRRADLAPGRYFEGPAVILQDDATTVVPPGFSVRVDRLSNLRITEGE